MQEDNKIVLQYNKLEARLALVEGRECDKYDYMIATFCGAIAGVIDSLFVGEPSIKDGTSNSILGKEVDKIAENAVEKFADVCISKDTKTYEQLAKTISKEGLGKQEFNKKLREELVKHGIPENFSVKKEYVGMRGNQSKLTYLENKFRISYDQSNSSKLVGDIPFALTPDNHHLKSPAHWPDLIGLIIAIADQFSGETTFISEGKIYREIPNHKLPMLRGETFGQKIFLGFVNWFGHLLSDFCGSHSSKGRGDGIPIPFFGLFMGCDFGNFVYETESSKSELSISELAVKVYEHGYDARFGAAMAIPVVIQDMMIRFLWSLKAHFIHKKAWNECIPTDKHKDLRMMLLVGNATLCVIDGSDAFIRSKGKALDFVLHLNIIAWYKLAKNSLKEICIRYDFTYEDLKVQFEYLDYQLEQYIIQLKNVNYNEYEMKIAELKSISEFIENDEWSIVIEAMDDFILRHNIRTDVTGRDDFKNKLTKKGFNFRIGGK